MAGSVTVVGSRLFSGGVGTTNGSLGLLTVTGAFQAGAISPLQSVLTQYSIGAVAGTRNFENIDAAGLTGNLTATAGASATGLFDLSNTSSVDGSVTAGQMNVSVNLSSAYNVIVVDAPGKATVNGGGAANTLAVFAGESTVNYNSGGGSGTVLAGGGGDAIVVTGGPWSVVGASTGGDTISGVAANSTIAVYGSGNGGSQSNVVSIGADDVTVNSFGTNDLVETYNDGTGVVSVHGTASVLVNGGAVTVYAAQGSNTDAFFNQDGGLLDFINTSTTQATVAGAVPGAIGGSVTAFGGAGGGVYAGGPGGNNSLVGGTGVVTLYGGGANSYLQASATAAGSTSELFASMGSTTMVGAVGSVNNEFHGSTGSASIISSGSGTQNYFVGASGQEIITGSTVSGAVNNYYFLQGSSGNGSDIITDFNLSRDKILINPFGGNSGVAVGSINPNGGAAGGSIISLTDNTTITLYGVSVAQLTAHGVKAGSTTI